MFAQGTIQTVIDAQMEDALPPHLLTRIRAAGINTSRRALIAFRPGTTHEWCARETAVGFNSCHDVARRHHIPKSALREWSIIASVVWVSL